MYMYIYIFFFYEGHYRCVDQVSWNKTGLSFWNIDITFSVQLNPLADWMRWLIRYNFAIHYLRQHECSDLSLFFPLHTSFYIFSKGHAMKEHVHRPWHHLTMSKLPWLQAIFLCWHSRPFSKWNFWKIKEVPESLQREHSYEDASKSPPWSLPAVICHGLHTCSCS